MEKVLAISLSKDAIGRRYSRLSFDKSRNKWEAYIHIEGKKKNLGRFETLKEAADTRHEAELKYWKEEDDVEI